MDLEQVLSELEPLNLDAPPFISAQAQAYFDYYGIDFERQMEGIAHRFGFFLSGGYEIVCHYFAPEEPERTCFISHGYLDHSALYKHLIAYCLERNWAVVIWDHPGHGLSTGERVDIDSFHRYTAVLQDCLALFDGHAPKPWCAVGQSMGGAVLLDYLLYARGHAFDSVVLLAPLLRTVRWHWVAWGYRLGGRWLSRVTRRFVVGSHDAKFCDFLENRDPMQSRVIPTRWVGAMFAWEREFHSFAAADAAPLIIQGLEDATVDADYNPAAIRTKLPAAKVFRLRRGRHHLVNEEQDIRERMWAAMDLYFARPGLASAEPAAALAGDA